MGTRFRVLVHHADPQEAAEAARAALARVGELDRLLSDYREDSELSRLSRAAGGAPVPCSEDLWTVLSLSQELARVTGGAFDVTSGPLVRLWRRARRRGELPDTAALERALALVGPELLELDPGGRTARCAVPGMRLDLGGIAKGHAIDEALRVLRQRGVTAALVEGGGDLAVHGVPPGAEAWQVAIEDLGPGAALPMTGGAIASSGDRYQGFESEGVRYSHIIDPRTGAALVGPRAAGVTCPSAAVSDALATALCVLGPRAGAKLLDGLAETEGWALAPGIRDGEPCLTRGLALRLRLPPQPTTSDAGTTPAPERP